MYAGLFSEWNSFYSDSTPIPYPVRIYPMSEFTPVYYTKSIVYEATLTTNDDLFTYIGLTADNLKDR